MRAIYLPNPIKSYRGNPLIESLGLPLLKNQFVARCTQKFDLGLDLSGIPDSHHNYYLKSAINQLSDVYIVRDEAFELYEKIRRLIEHGYSYRNLYSAEYIRTLAAIENDALLPLYDRNTKGLDIQRQNRSTFICGLSGAGKTSMVGSILNQLPMVIDHDIYTDENGKSHEIACRQITYIYVEVYERRSKKDFLEDILNQISIAAEENYSYMYRNLTTTKYIKKIRKLAYIHGIGLIIIDESQNLAAVKESEPLKSNEKVSKSFVEEIFNVIGVPLLFIGTYAILNLFGVGLTTARRASRDGSILLGPASIDSSFWKRFIKDMCPEVLLRHQKTDIDIIRHAVHDLSCGIPAIASALIQQTLILLAGLEPKNQDLSIKALHKVFNSQFIALRGPLAALKRSDFTKYEDLKCLVLLEEIMTENTYETEAPAKDKGFITGKLKIKSSKDIRKDKIETANNEISKTIQPENLIPQIGHKINSKVSP